MIINGAYGPYIKGPGRRTNIRIPKEEDPKKITEKKARKLLEDKFGSKISAKAALKKKKGTTTHKKATTKKSSRKK